MTSPERLPAGPRRTKVSVVSMNLSTNCTNRCLRIAEALSPEYDVEIVGTTFGVGLRWGEGLWPPLEGVTVPIVAVRGDYLPGYLRSILALMKRMDGDVIVACKPRFPSFGIALLKRMVSGKPVILDVDDDELAQTVPGRQATWIKQLINTSGWLFTRLVHPLHRLANGVFTVSAFFQQRYGGVLVPHGRDPSELDPERFDRTRIRQELDIAPDDVLIGFVGSPQFQKGIDLVLDAMTRLGNERLRLMVVGGEPDDPYVVDLASRFGRAFIAVPPQPITRIAYYLTAFDLVALPQRPVAESFGQMPAKLTDAMAMGKPVIASALADIPVHLEGRGIVIEPGNLDALVQAVDWVCQHPDEARAMGARARSFFLAHLTLDAMLAAMRPEIERVRRR